MNIEVYTDGSATTNDKPGGYGWVIIRDGIKYLEGSGYMPLASNNDAELEAAIQGLKEVSDYLEIVKANPSFYSNTKHIVTLVSDSQLILGWANGRYAFRQQDKIDKFKQLQLLVNLMDVKTRWVEGHTGDEYNERCDKLANDARLSIQNKVDKVEAILEGKALIGIKKSGIVCVWYKNSLKVIDLDQNIVEDYNRDIHGNRGSLLEIREEKSR